MPNFFPPPFPFFRAYQHPYYNKFGQSMTNISNNQNTSKNLNNNNNINNNFNNNFNKNNNYHQSNFPHKQNYSSNSNIKNIEYENNNCENNFHNEKNSITNKNSNTISSLLPFNISNFIPRNLGPLNININGFMNSDECVFELFGIKLFLDDIIIICILFFLYQENVKDEMLYIILIMLLSS